MLARQKNITVDVYNDYTQGLSGNRDLTIFSSFDHKRETAAMARHAWRPCARLPARAITRRAMVGWLRPDREIRLAARNNMTTRAGTMLRQAAGCISAIPQDFRERELCC